MMKMTQFKRYLKGIFLILFISFMFSFPSVIAEGIDDHADELDPRGRSEEVLEYCKTTIDMDELKKLYGAGLDYKGNKKFIVTINPNSSSNSELLNILKNTEFKIVRINNDKTTSPYIGRKVSYNNPLEINVETIPSAQIKDHDGAPVTGLLDTAVIIELESVDMVPTRLQQIIYDGENADCDAYVYFYLIYTSDGGAVEFVENYTRVQDVDCSQIDDNTSQLIKDYCSASSLSSETIRCESTEADAAKYGRGTVQFNFCETKRLALSNDFTSYLSSNGKFDQTKELPAFKCDPTHIREDSLKGDDYYTERDYFYAQSDLVFPPKDSETQYYYKYRFTPAANPDQGVIVGDAITCGVNCEEAVVVEYGPPIASKAGLCFQYQVRVRSYVNCEMKSKPRLPEIYSVCYPETACYSVHHPGVVYPQGGPDEEFHECIEKCDGGKYTPRCSQSCYKNVYGTSSNKVLSNSLNSLGFGQKLRSQGVSGVSAGPECLAPNGCYYRDANGEITFKGKTENSFASWYLYVYGVEEYTRRHPSAYCFNAYEGIPRRCSLDEEPGRMCYDPCFFIGCKGNYYLNAGYAEEDYKRNLEVYKSVVSRCTAAASCTTSTADFKIAVDYSYEDSEGKIIDETIVYPYSTIEDKTSQGDILESSSNEEEEKSPPNCFNSDGTRTDDKNCISTILDYNGCYRNANQKRWYLSEWSFPGTWISNKQHKISYKPVTGRGWTKVNNKFCLAQDALDVNQEWYNYYYRTQNNFLNESSYSDAEISKICDNYGVQITNASASEENKNKILYNIRAYAKNFGYYQWNINVKCFYATNNRYSEETNEVSEYSEECNPEDNYRIRSVDLNNLFPNEEGQYTGSEGVVGRTPGFNWSRFANNEKNDKFVSLPFEYALKVQKLGYNIYSEDYLDYHFNLTPSILKSISKNPHTYGNYDGEFVEEDNGVITYRSKLFRIQGNVIPEENKEIPSDEVLKCINIQNYNSTDCYYIQKDEEG